jgi:hypothetical protein
MRNRAAIIRELRHQLYYSNPGSDREAIRRELDFWIYNAPKGDR